MHNSAQKAPFPRSALVLAALAIILTFALIFIARWSGYDSSADFHAPVVQSELVSFKKRDDGAIAVYREPGRELALTISPEHAGFFDGLLKAQERERRRHSVPDDAPYQLDLLANGRLLLKDNGTSSSYDSGAFGTTSAQQVMSIFKAAHRPAPQDLPASKAQ